MIEIVSILLSLVENEDAVFLAKTRAPLLAAIF